MYRATIAPEQPDAVRTSNSPPIALQSSGELNFKKLHIEYVVEGTMGPKGRGCN